MGFAFPAQGQILYLANTALEPALPNTAIIPNGSYSMGMALNDSLGTSISVTYDDDATVATDIEYSATPDFDPSILLDTLPITTDRVAVWTTSAQLPGFIRIHNTSGVQINLVTIQKVVSTAG